MAGPVSERGDVFYLSHRGTGYTGGFSVSQDHAIAPGFIHVHVGLARVQATTGGPLGAAIGISQAMLDNQAFNFGGPDTWETALYPVMGGSAIRRKLSSFTVSAWVNKGDLTGWAFMQVWE